MKNKLHYSFLFCLCVSGALLILSTAQNINIGTFQLRGLDLLADVRHDVPMAADSAIAPETIAMDTPIPDSVVVLHDSIAHELLSGCPPGLSCIEDYHPQQKSLAAFLTTLSTLQTGNSFLRVAFYGDSFIEGDVFCGSFRDTLQAVFGGRGVGFVPITSNVTGFRNTIKHNFGNWETVSLITRRSGADIGPAGFTFIPKKGNWLHFRPSRQRFLREFNTVKLYYTNRHSAIMHYKLDTLEASEPLVTSENLEEWRFDGQGIRSVRMEFDPFDSLSVYGASFEGPRGIYVDNFSIRGNSGLTLNGLSQQVLTDFNRYRNYKLVILQFGLNLVVEERLNYEAFVKRMTDVIAKMKTAMPNSSFLLLSVSDKSVNDNGEYRTMDAIPVMRDAQRMIARESQIAFWDVYQAMGGENSMVKFVTATPPLGARDYTHLTFRGGRRLSGALVKSLIFELKKFQQAADANIQ